MLPPGFAGLPLSKKMKGPYQGDHFKRRPPKKQTKKGLTLPPGIALRTTKAAKASLFQPKGLPAPAAALPKIQPKALPKYRAAKAAKAKTPRKEAAPKAPKCVNGVVHVKAYTRRCTAKKKAGQAGKGIGSKLKTAAKIAGAAALAALAYKNRHVPGYAAYTAAIDRKVLNKPWGETLKDAGKTAYRGLVIPGIKENTTPKVRLRGDGRRKAAPRRKGGRGIGSKLKTAAKIAGAAALASLAYKNRDVLKDIPRTYDAFKKVHRGHPLNTHPRIHAAKLTAMDTLKNLKIPGRGIGSKLKTAAKVTGAAALAAGLALLARHNPHLTKNIKPVSQTQGSLYFPNASPWGPTY